MVSLQSMRGARPDNPTIERHRLVRGQGRRMQLAMCASECRLPGEPGTSRTFRSVKSSSYISLCPLLILVFRSCATLPVPGRVIVLAQGKPLLEVRTP